MDFRSFLSKKQQESLLENRLDSAHIKNQELENKNLKLITENLKLRKRNKEQEKLIYVDSKTELYNEQGFYKTFPKFINASLREDYDRRIHRPTGVFYFDLSGLKNANDTYGDATGNLMLRGIANALRQSSRDQDLLARFYGDTFVWGFTIDDRELKPDQKNIITLSDDHIEQARNNMVSRLQGNVDHFNSDTFRYKDVKLGFYDGFDYQYMHDVDNLDRSIWELVNSANRNMSKDYKEKKQTKAGVYLFPRKGI